MNFWTHVAQFPLIKCSSHCNTIWTSFNPFQDIFKKLNNLYAFPMCLPWSLICPSLTWCHLISHRSGDLVCMGRYSCNRYVVCEDMIKDRKIEDFWPINIFYHTKTANSSICGQVRCGCRDFVDSLLVQILDFSVWILTACQYSPTFVCQGWWSPGWRESLRRLTLSNMSQHFMLILCRQGLLGVWFIYFSEWHVVFFPPRLIHPTRNVQIPHENPALSYTNYSLRQFKYLLSIYI